MLAQIKDDISLGIKQSNEKALKALTESIKVSIEDSITDSMQSKLNELI